MRINKKSLNIEDIPNKGMNIKESMKNFLKDVTSKRVKKIVDIVRATRKKGYRFLIDLQKSKNISKFKGEFEEFMIGHLDKALEDIEDNVHEIDKERNSL